MPAQLRTSTPEGAELSGDGRGVPGLVIYLGGLL